MLSEIALSIRVKFGKTKCNDDESQFNIKQFQLENDSYPRHMLSNLARMCEDLFKKHALKCQFN